MQHEIHRVTHFQVEDAYTLAITFEDGASRIIDFSPVLRGELYGPLMDLAVFNGVQIDEEVGTLVWPNGADFDPDTLYHWSEHVEELAERATLWD